MKERIQRNISNIINDLPEDVILCAVTKYHDLDETRAVIEAGIKDIGENKVQDLLAKQQVIDNPDVRWHMIGHLQTNKVKKLIGHVALIHSVDSVRLIESIEKESAEAGVVTPILLQIALTGEETKFGLAMEDLPTVLAILPSKSHICLKGVMGMGAAEKKPSENRKIFKQLKEIYDTIKKTYMNGENMIDTLSMGMTDDYPIAVEEGTTLVRIGRKIFE